MGASSDIDFTAPTGLSVTTGGIITIEASSYVSDGPFSVSCGTTQSHSLISSIFEDGCSYEVTVGTSTGTATFTVPYTSTGGDTHDGVISLVIGAVPTLDAAGCTDGTFVDVTANPRVTGASNDLVEDCQALVAAHNLWAGIAVNTDLHSSYFIRTWGTGTPEQQKIDRWEGVTVTSGRVTGLEIDNTGEEDGISGSIPTQLGSLTALTSLDISYNQLSGAIPTQIGSLTALTALDLSANQLSGAIPSQLGSLAALTQLYLGSNQLSGAIPTQLGSLSSLTDLYLGGNRLTGSVPTELGTIATLGTFSICNNQLTGDLPVALRTGVTLIGYPIADGYTPIACQNAVSNIVFTAPQNLKVGRNFTLEIDASDYITENSAYTVSCGDASGVDSTRLTSVSRTADTCTFTVDPIDTLASSLQGDTTFSVPLTSTGGHSLDATFTVNVGPDSAISYTAPTGLLVGRNRTLVIDASGYVEETAGSGYTITCSDASSVHVRLTSVTRTANTCSYTIDPVDTATSGNAAFTVTFTSDGGHSRSETITVEIGTDSTITYTPPSGLLVGRNLTLAINVLDHITEDSVYTVSCGDASGVDNTRLTGVTHTGSSCTFTVTS